MSLTKFHGMLNTNVLDSEKAKRQMTMRKTLFIGLLLTASSVAIASGPHPAMTGFAASADDASVAGKNPAGMTRFESRVSRGQLLGFFSESTWEGELGNGTPYELVDDGTTVIPSGNMVMPFGDNYWFGFTMLGGGFSEDYGTDWAGRYFVQDYDLLFLSAFPSIATKLSDRWSIAGSLAVTYTSYEQNKAVVNLGPGEPDGSLLIDADGFTVGFGLSTLYEFSEQTRFGIAYRSELDPELEGDANFSDLNSTTEALFSAAGLLGTDVDVKTRQPQSLLAGLYHEFGDGSNVTFDVMWADFSEFKLSEIYIDDDQITGSDVDYDDIFAVSVGYNWPISDRTMVGVGYMYIDDMVSDEERTMTMRVDSAWSAGVGLTWQWTDRRVVFATLNYMKAGDAPITSPTLGQLGSVTGRFVDRDTIWMQIGVNFGTDSSP